MAATFETQDSKSAAERAGINAKISGRILTYYANGLTLQQAIDKVCGVATYECLVEELWVELRAKAGLNP